MSHYQCVLVSLTVWVALTQSAVAQDAGSGHLPPARLVADIKALTGSSNPQPLAAVGHVLFFMADDGLHGNELWRTDGTEAGTYLVKNIKPDTATQPGQAMPFAAIAFGNVLLFAADDGAHGKELWISDGTAAGTTMLADLNPGGATSSSSPSNFTLSGGRVFFSATRASDGNELWMTDGSSDGTVLVKDIAPGVQMPSGVPMSSAPGSLRDVNGVLYFAAGAGTTGFSNREPWVSDGTPEGTHLLKDIVPPPGGSNPGNFTPLQGRVYFTASTPTQGLELWSTDGTEGGTMLVKDILSGPFGSNPASLTAFRDELLFVAQDSAVGRELWVSDGTPGGTYSLTNLAGSGVPASPIAVLGGTAVFYAQETTNGSELWRTDGKVDGTFLLMDINPGGSSAFGGSVTFTTVAGLRVFFAANDGETGSELWTSAGTAEGTFRAADIRVGALGSSPSGVMVAGDTLYFSADDGVTGRELWALSLAPMIAFSGNHASYGVDETIAITCTVTETFFPLVSASCPSVTAPAYEFPLGENTLTATATDAAGNTAEAHVTFTVTVDFNSLAALVTRFTDGSGVGDGLNAKLYAAAAADERGNARARTGILGAFVNEIDAQTGKALTAEQAAILLRLVEAL